MRSTLKNGAMKTYWAHPWRSVNRNHALQQLQHAPDVPALSWFMRFLASTRDLGSLVTHGELLRRLLICYVMWLVVALTYYSLSLNAENFGSDRYIYTAAGGAVEVVSYVMPIPILRWVGRRPTPGVMFLVSGVSLLFVLPIPNGVIMSVSMVGRLCIGAVYSVIVLYTNELFPTVNRNTAMGTSATWSHMGGIVAPCIVILLGEVAWYIPSTICALGSLAAGLLTLVLPETKDKELSDTVEEMKRARSTVTGCQSGTAARGAERLMATNVAFSIE